MKSISLLNILIALSLILGAASLAAGQFRLDGMPAKLKCSRPPTKEELNKRKALKLYALGLLCEREDRLIEALQAFEKAAKLNPEAVPVLKKQAALYLELARIDEAASVCQEILKLEPDDAQTWFMYARQLRVQLKDSAAKTALEKCASVLDVKRDPDLAQRVYYELGTLQAEADEPAAAESFTRCAKVLDGALRELKLPANHRRELEFKLAALYEKIGAIHLEEKQFAEALAAYKQAQKVNPFSASRTNFNLAQICQAQGKLGEALRYVDAYLKLQPQGLEAYKMKIGLLKKLGKSKTILAWLESAAKNDRFNTQLKMLLAEQYVRRNSPAKAEAIYAKLVKKEAKAEVYQKLFRLYRKSGQFGLFRTLDLINKKLGESDSSNFIVKDRAKGHARAIITALQQDPTLATDLFVIALPLLKSNEKLHRQTVYVLGVLAYQNGRLQEAEAFYRQALRNTSPQTESLVYGGLLRVLWKAKKYEDVISLCKDGLRNAKASNHVVFHSNQARALARLNKLDAALKEAKQAVRLASESDHLTVKGLYIQLLIQDKQYKEAESECKRLLQQYKQPGEIHTVRFLLSHLYSTTKNFKKAENELQLILEADPTNAGALNDLGYFWADQGKHLKKAEKMIRRALALDREKRKTIANPAVNPDEDNAAYVDSLGWVLFRLGRLKDARKHLERAAKLTDDDPVIWDHLGDVYFRLEMGQEAQRCWEKALNLYEIHQARPLDRRYEDLKQKIQLLKVTP